MSHKKYDVYIAGSMTGRKVCTVLMERWIACAILEKNDLTYYNPANNEGLEKMKNNSLISNAFDKKRMVQFVKKDLNAVSQCKAVLNISGDLPSEGSTWEMAYAVYHRQIPVHIFAPERKKGAKMTFTNILVDGIHDSLYAAIRAIKKDIKEIQ